MSDETSRVYMVDDNAADVYLVRQALREAFAQCVVQSEEDGEGALRFIEECEDGRAPIPAIFLLDLNVPRVTGLELLERIRTSRALNAVPVVVLSASDSPGDHERILNQRAVFFRKPSNLDDFMALGPFIKTLITGEVGSPDRLDFDQNAVHKLLDPKPDSV
jgi:CheY-like chemotaxis protein